MKTYFIVVQMPHGKNANPVNHIKKLITVCADQESAEGAALQLTGGTSIRRIQEIKPGQIYSV